MRLYTQQELEVWKKRWSDPAFATAKNAILSRYNHFISNPGAEHYTADPEPVVRKIADVSLEPHKNGLGLRDAGFVYLLTGDDTHLKISKDAFLKQIREPKTDFSNRARWPLSLDDGNPIFFIAEWVLRLLFYFKYVESTFTASEKEEAKKWFLNAGSYLRDIVDSDLNVPFVNRQEGNYTFSGKTFNVFQVTSDKLFDNGPQVQSINKWYNNRRCTMVRTFGIIGLFTGNDSIIDSAKLYFKEWLKFGVEKTGLLYELERASEALPDLGLSYSSISIGTMGDMADIFARNDMPELYNMEVEGKSFLQVMKKYCNFIDGSFKVSIFGKVIDGVNLSKKWILINHINFWKYNLYYKDSYVSQVMNRPLPDPANIAENGSHQPFSGVWELYPDLRLMYKDLPVDPFGTGISLSELIKIAGVEAGSAEELLTKVRAQERSKALAEGEQIGITKGEAIGYTKGAAETKKVLISRLGLD